MRLFESTIRSLFFSVLVVCFSAACGHGADLPRVVLLNPGAVGDPFFQPMTDFMQAAADDLGFELTVLNGGRNHVLIDEMTTRVFTLDPLPDYIVGMNARGSGKRLLAMAETNGVKTVIINQGFNESERDAVGYPGEKYASWLFEFTPDDTHAGYVLARSLIRSALARRSDGQNETVKVVGVSGHKSSPASLLREQGLRRAVSEMPEAELMQVVHAEWKRGKAVSLAAGLLKRYPSATVIWAASDVMADGVLEAGLEAGRTAGRDLITGGVDWAEIGLSNVRSGACAVTVGGHFMDGGWALVMLYDMLNGVDVSRLSTSRFSMLTQENVEQYDTFLHGTGWERIDFTRFSRNANPSLKEYDFSIEAVLEQIR